MLYGMADSLKHALAEMNYRVRVYCPVGELLPGMAYLVRRLLENTSNESFLRAGFIEHAPEEQLLMNPTLFKRPRVAEPKNLKPAAASTGFDNEPLSDFSHESARSQMSRAIADFCARPVGDHAIFIDGQPIFTGKWIESINPSHKSKLIARCACATPEHADPSRRRRQFGFSHLA